MDKGVWALAIIRTAESIHRVSPCGTKQTKWPRSGSPSIPFSFYEPPIAVSLDPVSLSLSLSLPTRLLLFTYEVLPWQGRGESRDFRKCSRLFSHPCTRVCGKHRRVAFLLSALYISVSSRRSIERRIYLHFTDREWSIGERSAIKLAREMLFLARLSQTIICRNNV